MKSNRKANLTVALPVSKKQTNKQKTLSLNGLINGKVEIIRSISCVQIHPRILATSLREVAAETLY